MTLEKSYTPQNVEDKWYKKWMDNGLFEADEKSKKEPYCIVIPPPNVTGVLTMGHVLNNTLQDILVRRKRMQGFEVLWLPGTDHAGIATQTVVEKTLKNQGKIKHRDDMGRAAFVKQIWEWKHKHGNIIIQQLKKLGCSCDWSRLVFTMDGLDASNKNPRIDYSLCVKEIFVKLFEKGLIYRGKRMVNWCPVSQTALSDEEVIMKEVDGHLWYFKYPLLDENNSPIHNKFIIVATTRPETMLGDEAVAVHPEDERYKDLVGKKVLLPLLSKPIPIIADEVVERQFGTGAVKVTPAHDPVDYEIAIRHNLPFTVVIGPNGIMTSNAGERYEGLDRFECRKAVVADLEEWKLLHEVKAYRHNVGFSERADVLIEPTLSSQWFLKYPQQKASTDAVLNGDIKFWPDRWSKVFAHWMDNLKDWCISRQLWWGHRIPVWYCTNDEPRTTNHEKCPPIVSIETPKKCPKCGGKKLKQDEDVLDTWFSSWLWPFATLGWPNKTKELEKFYPTSDLVTGPDIIFFWVARMIMAGFEFVGKKPFSNVYYTGIIRDSLGRKMSKSLGNSPDPLDLIEKYGADGLRFGLMLIAPKGQDILFSEDRLEIGRNFCNKLWNATRFILMNTPEDKKLEAKDQKLNLSDKWILNKLEHTIREVNLNLDKFDFDSTARALYQFVWRDLCDWYVELSKVHLYEETDSKKEASINTLLKTLSSTIKLLHPFMPFITEEIWHQPELQNINEKISIMKSEFPVPQKTIPFEKEAADFEIAKQIIDAIRNIRGEHNIKPKQQIDVTIKVTSQDERNLIDKHSEYILKLSSIKTLDITDKLADTKDVSTAVIGGLTILVPHQGLVDVESEKLRLEKEISKSEKEKKIVENKLQNESFVARAPKPVVEKEQNRLNELNDKLEKLQKALKSMSF